MMRIILQNWDYWMSLAKLIKTVDLKNLIRTNLPNSITTIGIILTVWLDSLLFWGEPVEHRLLILLLAVGIIFSDLDGFLARYLKAVNFIGDCLDKFRDKFFACSVFAYFLQEIWRWTDGIWLPFIKGLILFILATEFFLMSIWIIGFVKGLNMDTHRTGKTKTDFYFAAIGWWFFLGWLEDWFERELESHLYWGLISLLSIGSFFGILSVVAYLQRYNKKNN